MRVISLTDPVLEASVCVGTKTSIIFGTNAISEPGAPLAPLDPGNPLGPGHPCI